MAIKEKKEDRKKEEVRQGVCSYSWRGSETMGEQRVLTYPNEWRMKLYREFPDTTCVKSRDEQGTIQ